MSGLAEMAKKNGGSEAFQGSQFFFFIYHQIDGIGSLFPRLICSDGLIAASIPCAADAT